MENIEEDTIGKIFSDDISKKSGIPKSDTLVGKLLLKVFKHIKISKVYRNGHRVTCYSGVFWNCRPSNETILWQDVTDLLPKSVMVLHQDLELISIGLKSNTYCNGSFIMKEVHFLRQEDDSNSCTWQLKVRGQKVDLNELFIDNKVQSLNEKSLKQILKIVECLELCRGFKYNYCIPFESKQIIQEKVSVNECSMSSSELQYRSERCQQVVSFISQSSYFFCKKCQKLKLNIEAKTEKETKRVDNDKENVCCKPNIAIHSKGDDHALSCMKECSVPKNLSEKPICDKDDIFVSESDHADLSNILESIFPNASDKMKLFLKSQHEILCSKSPQARRWNKDVVSLCLSLWIRSPKAYQTLLESNVLVLPSGRQLRRYKNCIPQEPGICDTTLRWMYESAKGLKLPPNGWVGGLHHDETKVQQDLVVEMKGGTPIITGWIDLGEEAQNLRVMKDQTVTRQLASEVIQITFVGFTGFRFPICHFPTGGIKASELSIIIWNVIEKLSDWGFQIDYIMQDGGEENRSFMNLHFNGNPRDTHYGSPNLVYPLTTIFHTQDFSHNIKKLRNSILKSGDIKGVHTRKLTLHGNFIVWKQWEMAVEWDRTVNARRIHHKVTDSHLHPNLAEKMRNELAETMLDSEMLNLMKSYQNSLSNASVLDGAIELLENTSSLIKIFRDKALVTSISDQRLSRLKEILQWWQGWQKEVMDLKNESKHKMLPSKQCVEDIENMLLSFPAICQQHLEMIPGASIKPSRFNNDIAENIFCQEKGMFNGSNSNPTYANYCKTVNSVVLGQSLKSRARKSNAGLESAKCFSISTNQPVLKKCRKSPKQKKKMASKLNKQPIKLPRL